jgi:ferredoxin-NADP reductase
VRGYSKMMVSLKPIGEKARSARAKPSLAKVPRPAPQAQAAKTAETERELRVAARRDVAEGIIELTLSDATGAPLPAWTAGAHIDLVLNKSLTRQYSLCGSPADASSLKVGVLCDPESRGGSAFVHDQLVQGATVRVRGPRNHFPLVASPRYQFIAGGIGITPILPMIEAAEARGADWSLLYVGRSRASMAFLDRFEGNQRVTVWPRDENGRFNLASVLGTPQPGTRVYCCGPEALMDAVEAGCESWPEGSLHLERFAAKVFEASADALDTFEVECARSGITVTVGKGTTIFDAVEKAGVDILGSCMEGICGTCECDVLEGTPEHRDSVLSKSDRERGDTIMTCVSRSLSKKLVLDL